MEQTKVCIHGVGDIILALELQDTDTASRMDRLASVLLCRNAAVKWAHTDIRVMLLGQVLMREISAVFVFHYMTLVYTWFHKNEKTVHTYYRPS